MTDQQSDSGAAVMLHYDAQFIERIAQSLEEIAAELGDPPVRSPHALEDLAERLGSNAAYLNQAASSLRARADAELIGHAQDALEHYSDTANADRDSSE